MVFVNFALKMVEKVAMNLRDGNKGPAGDRSGDLSFVILAILCCPKSAVCNKIELSCRTVKVQVWDITNHNAVLPILLRRHFQLINLRSLDVQ
jgi:hypothetical protein